MFPTVYLKRLQIKLQNVYIYVLIVYFNCILLHVSLHVKKENLSSIKVHFNDKAIITYNVFSYSVVRKIAYKIEKD